MILLPAVWAALHARGMSRAELRAIAEPDLVARLLALEAEAARVSDNPFRDVLTAELAAVVAHRLKRALEPGPDGEP